MRKISLFKSKKLLSVGFDLILAVSFFACDSSRKIPSFLSPGESQNSTVIQTEWKNTDSSQEDMKQTGGVQDSVSANFPLPQEKTGGPGAQLIEDQGKYIVQVGAFLNKNNAKKLIKQLRKKGYQPTLTVNHSSNKQWNIVRIGSFEHKSKALEAAKAFSENQKMESIIFLHNAIVKTFRNDSGKTVGDKKGFSQTSSFSKEKRYTFQVGGLLTNSVAKKQKRSLRKKGYSPYIAKIKNENSDIWYVVRIGNYGTIDAAAAAAGRFFEKENFPAHARQRSN